MSDVGPQKGPSATGKILAESKLVQRELKEVEDQQYPSLLRDKLKAIDAQLAELHKAKQLAIESAVASCDHPLEAIRELPYQSDSFGTSKPWLVCTCCGLAEQGWYCGYVKLKHAEYRKPPTITRTEFQKIALLRKTQPIKY